VRVADFLEDDYALLVDDERRRMRRLMRRVPAEPVLIGYRIVRIRHEKDVRWQLCLPGQELAKPRLQECEWGQGCCSDTPK
jgi:hypothetical protein